MKKFLALVLLLICAPAFCFAQSAPKDDLYIFISIMRTEFSQDPRAPRKVIKAMHKTAWLDKRELTYLANGFKDYKTIELTDKELQSLREIIESWDLPDLNTNKFGRSFNTDTEYFYFSMGARVRLNGKETSVGVSGSPKNTGIKNDLFYQTADGLIREVFRIIHKRDETIDYFGMIDFPPVSTQN